MQDQHVLIIAIAAFFCGLSWITVGMRVYVRGFMKKTWGKDDTFIIATMPFFTVYLSMQFTAQLHGSSRHRWQVSDKDARLALLCWWIGELFYVIAGCLLKISIGYFYLRVAQKKWHVLTIQLLMSSTIFGSLVYFFLVMFQCTPISEFWTNHPASDKCLNRAITLGSTYAIAGCNAAADWTLGTLPFLIVWDLKMKSRTKILVASILGFAAIGSTGTVVRMFYFKTLMNGEDFLHATTGVALWTTVELGIGISASSIATLRPLFRLWAWKMGVADPPADRRRFSYFDERNKPHKTRCFRRSLSPSALHTTRFAEDFADESMSSNSSHGLKPFDEENLYLPPFMTHARSMSDLKQAECGGAFVGADKAAEDGRRGRTMSEGGHRDRIVVREEEVAPLPRLQIRDSFRNSTGMGSIFHCGKRMPED